MRTVWVVMNGEYSDKVIDSVYTSKEGATAYVKRHENLGFSPEVYNIEEHELDPADECPEGGYPICEIWMDRNGQVLKIEFARIERKTKTFGLMSRLLPYSISNGPCLFVTGPWEESERERAIKVANGIRGQKIAIGEWG